MTIASSNARNRGSDRGDYGFARVRDIAFDAVHMLWRKRHAKGMKQSDIAKILNRDPGWVSKQFSAPGNWTLRTIGELIEAMDGELEIRAVGIDESYENPPNYDAYSGYGGLSPKIAKASHTSAIVIPNLTDPNSQTRPTSWSPPYLKMELSK